MADATVNLAMAIPIGRIAGVGAKLTGEVALVGRRLFQGGKTFAQFKAAMGGTETLAYIQTSTGIQRISTEFHHLFISQRLQRLHKLPNWVVNNRINVVKLNTIQHSLLDPNRYRFLKPDIKSDVGWFGNYNWFSNF